jgi:hypothetical protein
MNTPMPISQPSALNCVICAVKSSVRIWYWLGTMAVYPASGQTGSQPAGVYPRFLVRSAATMKNLRRMCEEESPGPLKRRNLFAPADYLRFA